MDNNQINEIARVIHNKIYNTNIFLCEKLALKEESNPNPILNFQDISVLDIKRAIEYGEDLNQINGLNIKDYICMDLNVFLSHVIKIRENDIKSYAEIIKNASDEDIELFPHWIPTILDYFTYEESLELKRTFVKRMINYSDIDLIANDHIENIFFDILKGLDNIQEESTTFARK